MLQSASSGNAFIDYQAEGRDQEQVSSNNHCSQVSTGWQISGKYLKAKTSLLPESVKACRSSYSTGFQCPTGCRRQWRVGHSKLRSRNVCASHANIRNSGSHAALSTYITIITRAPDGTMPLWHKVQSWQRLRRLGRLKLAQAAMRLTWEERQPFLTVLGDLSWGMTSKTAHAREISLLDWILTDTVVHMESHRIAVSCLVKWDLELICNGQEAVSNKSGSDTDSIVLPCLSLLCWS